MSDRLFYDSRCPLCRREIALLARISRPGLSFQDIHTAQGYQLPGTEELLRSLHLQRASGEILIGLEANVAAWQHTPFGVAWRALLLPIVRPLTESLYDYWAQRRYRRLYQCALSQEKSA